MEIEYKGFGAEKKYATYGDLPPGTKFAITYPDHGDLPSYHKLFTVLRLNCHIGHNPQTSESIYTWDHRDCIMSVFYKVNTFDGILVKTHTVVTPLEAEG